MSFKQYFRGLAAAHQMIWSHPGDPVRLQSSIGKLSARRRYVDGLLLCKRIVGRTEIRIEAEHSGDF